MGFSVFVAEHRPAIRRASYGFADQALSSLTNFVLAVVVARYVTAVEFGVFGLMIASYLIMLTLNRAVVLEPMMIDHSASFNTPAANKVASLALGATVLVSLGAATIVAAVAVVLAFSDVEGTRPFLLLAAMAPMLLAQDAVRYIAVTQGRPQIAATSDGMWAILQFGGIAGVIAFSTPSMEAFVACWGAGSLAGALTGMLMLWARPRLVGGFDWLRKTWRLSKSLTADFFLRSISKHLALYLVAIIAGLETVAGLKAAETLFGPLHVVFLGSALVLLPEGVRVATSEVDRMEWFLGLITGLLLVVAALWSAIVVFMPDAVGMWLFGDSWRIAGPIIASYVAVIITRVGEVGYVIALRSLGEKGVRRILRTRIRFAPMVSVGLVGGAAWNGAIGAVVGMAVAQALGLGLWRSAWTQELNGQR